MARKIAQAEVHPWELRKYREYYINKMSKFDIWTIIGTGTFVVTFGVFVVIRKVRQYTHEPTNVLTRSGDIELQETIQSGFNPRDVDLSSLPQYPQSQAVINHLPIRWAENNPPRYSQLTGNFINSPLEFEVIFPDGMILFLILAIFMVIIFIYFRWKMLNKSDL